MDIVEALGWLDARTDHERSTTSIAAGRIDGLSLDTMSELMALLGDPQRDVPVIHITGTNGKGTVAAMVTALLRAHGLSVGSYTSPHIERVNERISRDGQPIGDEDLAEVLGGIAAVESLLDSTPSWFEVMTAAALRWFAECPVDVAVVEVGLLGRFDATNVVDAQVAVVTSIAGDHTDFAPGWEVSVATEKAGIIGADSTAVLGRIDDALVPVFEGEGPVELVRLGHDFDVESDQVAIGGHLVELRGRFSTVNDLFLRLHGAHQVDNAAVSVAAVESFFERAIPDELVREAFAALELPGRFEVVGHAPLVVFDGAHNEDALVGVARTLEDEFAPAGSRLIVLGVLRGRDPVAAARAVAEIRPDLVICTTVDGERGLDAVELVAACRGAGLATERIADPQSAVARALAIAAEEDAVVVTGSFRLLGPARSAVLAHR